MNPSSRDFQAEASKIVKELFCLPVAIDQAGGYLASGVTHIGDYLSKYLKYRRALLSYSGFTGASKYNRSIYGTWELSYKEIQQWAESHGTHKANAANSAMLLLQLFPFFHHEGITEEIFYYAALSEYEETSSSNLPHASSLLDRRLLPLDESGTWDNNVFREGLRILLSFSLIKQGPSSGVYSMHPLVHAWGRDRLTLEEKQRCSLMGYTVLSCSLKSDGSQPYSFRRILVTHVRANMQYIMREGDQTTLPYFDDAYEKFWELLREQGYASEAEGLIFKVVDERNRTLGVEHPDTIRASANLAKSYQDLRKYSEAEKMEIQVLDARNHFLGAEHPDTINAMADLAETYRALNKCTEAEKLEIQVVDARNRILGSQHPDTINAIANLAETYRALNKYIEAEKLEIQVFNARSRILALEHPDTVTALANLAETARALNKYVQAEKLEIQVLDARNRILGLEHPATINALANLAKTYQAMNNYAAAEKLEIQVVDARNRIFGAEHPDTINAMANLAETYRALNQYSEAEELEIQVVDVRNRIFGAEHPTTIDAMANLAETYRALNQYAEAEELEIQVVDSRSRFLGAEHPYMIKGMENLIATYKALRKYKEAEELRIKILDVKNQVLRNALLDPMRTAYNGTTTKALQDDTNDPQNKCKIIQSQTRGTVIAQLNSPS